MSKILMFGLLVAIVWPVMGFIARQLYFLFMLGWNL